MSGAVQVQKGVAEAELEDKNAQMPQWMVKGKVMEDSGERCLCGPAASGFAAQHLVVDLGLP